MGQDTIETTNAIRVWVGNVNKCVRVISRHELKKSLVNR